MTHALCVLFVRNGPLVGVGVGVSFSHFILTTARKNLTILVARQCNSSLLLHCLATKIVKFFPTTKFNILNHCKMTVIRHTAQGDIL